MKRFLLLVSVLGLCYAVPKDVPSYVQSMFLPDSVIPYHYNLTIVTNLNEETFYGDVSIEVQCKYQTDVIKLHAVNMDNKLVIHEESVKVKVPPLEDNQRLVESTSWELGNQFFVIKLNKPIRAETAFILQILFDGKMDTTQKGYFLIKEKKNKLASTQFGKSWARYAFPCFDEPHLKATFIIKIGHKLNEQSFSTMPLKTRYEMDQTTTGWVYDEYEVTPLMSTYMVSYVVSSIPLKSTEPCNNIRYWYREDGEEPGYLRCDYTINFLDKLTSKYGLPKIFPEPLPKLDFILHPAIAVDVLGNLGLVISNGLPDKSKSGLKERMFWTYEKLVWQWFGGLVSPDWYNSFWIYKAIIGYVAQSLMPEDVSTTVITTRTICWDILSRGSQFTDDEKSISEVFTENTNSLFIGTDMIEIQGECKNILLLRMLHLSLGDKVFKKGLQKFFSDFKFKAAGAQDLWSILNYHSKGLIRPGTQRIVANLASSTNRFIQRKLRWSRLLKKSGDIYRSISLLPAGVSLNEIMKSWTGSDCTPVIKVTRIKNGVVKVTQKCYQPTIIARQRGDSSTCLWLPLTYSTAITPDFSDTKTKKWIGCPPHQGRGLTINTGAGDSDWIIFNNQFSAPYKVTYDDDNWNLIISSLMDLTGYSKIPTFNQGQLVNDVMSLAFIGDVKYEHMFNLLQFLRHEADLNVWKFYFINLVDLVDSLRHTDVYGYFQDFTGWLLTNLFDQTFSDTDQILTYISLNTPKYDDEDVWKVKYVFSFSCNFNVEKCVSFTRNAFAQWRNKNNIPTVTELFPRTLAKEIICSAISQGSDEDFDFLLQQLTSSESRNPKRQLYLDTLPCTESEKSLTKLLDWATTRTNDKTTVKEKHEVFKLLIERRVSYKTSLTYFYENYDHISSYLSEPWMMENLIYLFAKYMVTEERDEDTIMQFSKLESYINTKSVVESVSTALQSAREEVDLRALWRDNFMQSIEEALKLWSKHKNIVK